jgi:hypothetical protein
MKYYSAVLAVFKNECSFLPEWINHYLTRGIEHIYLLDDSSTDNFCEKIQKYIDEGRVTLKHVEDCDQDKTIEWRQVYLYNKYYQYALKETYWIGVLDLDEFFYSPSIKNLNEIFRLFEKTSFQELLADWYWFGSNDHLTQPKEIVLSFSKRSRHPARFYNFEKQGYHHEWCCKSFSKTKLITKIKHHFNEFKNNGKNNFCSEGKKGNDRFSLNLSSIQIAFINHYLGSKDYYLSKRDRGSCNNSSILRDETLYNLINMNEVLDTRLTQQNYDYQ